MKNVFTCTNKLREKYKKDPSKIPEGDADYPDAEDLGVCKKGGCLGYHYNTKADQDRHIKLAHGGKVKFRNIDQNEAVEGPPRKKSFLCPFKDCQLNFPSEWKLRKHRDESGHRMAGTKGGRPQKKK